ncbi:Type III restriction enzyme, res subunit [Paenibacillus sp. RU4T]|uniref:DEAD/DEAH box helicase family protein n=1 Tax=unclassified Paenibacillus TaxID=185978 RepID=UPI000953F6CB|nr:MULTISPECIES: DEAD/DEAH box helicase family protein [unclassified Paenibacillus]SIR64880.1 Type III restriction enzyme, res subunit [Paenibacillus sp. RU4X]SIR72820.1 Type III restriction enzyme, res subunit [Paenibacillus sp. RU4T]
MKSFPRGILFCHPWRSYQKRILDGLGGHLANRHLHIVAPPGSGKTVLGLEVMLRIGGPAIILAPTLAIKNQWADRFTELFLQQDERPDWLSTSLKRPAFLTITTYKALQALYKAADAADSALEAETADGEERLLHEEGEEGFPEPAAKPKASGHSEADGEPSEEPASSDEARAALEQLLGIGFSAFVLDEAHHLRTSWWKSAMRFRAELDKPVIVALTATPPYDAAIAEWDRYMELCSPIDAEISVPELVREDELCPHQDYIHLSLPSPEEQAKLREFRERAASLRRELPRNQALVDAVVSHPWMTGTDERLEEILASPAFFSSMVIYLKAAGHPLWKQAAEAMGMEEAQVPPLQDEWMEELLTGLLFTGEPAAEEDSELKRLRRRLHGDGAVERKKVYLKSTPAFDKMLVQSASKLNSIRKIAAYEKDKLGDDLRMLILTDYIRKEELPGRGEEPQKPGRLGVVPIFEMIRREMGAEAPIAILSGSLVVLPADALPAAQEAASRRGAGFSFRPLPHDPGYLMLDSKDSDRAAAVSVMTEIFLQGHVRILVGTAALLGEGWDAPGINSLIMASYVGSYMLSNQMRGRAIRTDKGNPNKTAAIWHLACVDIGMPGGGKDMQSLGRRFRSLVGLSVEEDSIETGIGRMGLGGPSLERAKKGAGRTDFSRSFVEGYNEETFRRADLRGRLKAKWQSAIAVHEAMKEGVAAAGGSVPRPFYFSSTIKALLVFGAAASASAFFQALRSPRMITGEQPLWLKLFVAAIFGLVVSSPWLYKGIKLYFRHQSLESSLRAAAEVVYESLHEMKRLEPEPGRKRLKTESSRGEFICWMEGGTPEEKTVFLNALRQLLEPIQNPRYILYRESRLGLLKRKDYHAVPDEIGSRKEDAERFHALWKKKLGPAELIATRTTAGRKKLLAARTGAMSAAFVEKTERISAWR